MRGQKGFMIAVIGLFLWFMAAASLAQPTSDEFSKLGIVVGPNLVVTAVSGPATAIHKDNITVTVTVKNTGNDGSDGYQVDLYLSKDSTIDPAADRLLKNLTVRNGLNPGRSRTTTAQVLVPTNGLAGDYYYGAVLSYYGTVTSIKASLMQLSLAHYSVIDDNATVKDHKTGLLWQSADDGLTRNWADANQYCGDSGLGGYDDWRLPQIEELQTIVDYSRSNPSADPVFKCRSKIYWTGGSKNGSSDGSWYVSFSDGKTSWHSQTNNHYVRCVRGGP
jgi:hypothetical protein